MLDFLKDRPEFLEYVGAVLPFGVVVAEGAEHLRLGCARNLRPPFQRGKRDATADMLAAASQDFGELDCCP